MTGVITIVQERRFKMEPEDGQPMLFVLSPSAPIEPQDLPGLQRSQARVTVRYEDAGDLIAGIVHDIGFARVPTADKPVEGMTMNRIRRRTISERIGSFVHEWSVPRQIAGQSSATKAAESSMSRGLRPRLEEADTVGTNICPYCAVGCSQLMYARNGRVIHVEGDPRSPINQGTLCPKGAATLGLMTMPERHRQGDVPGAAFRPWEEKPMDWAMERIAQLAKRTRDETFVHKLPDGTIVNHTLAVGSLGGATLDNEENYLIKKLFSGGLGMVWIENQARV